MITMKLNQQGILYPEEITQKLNSMSPHICLNFLKKWSHICTLKHVSLPILYLYAYLRINFDTSNTIFKIELIFKFHYL